jgi:hypothetical protein
MAANFQSFLLHAQSQRPHFRPPYPAPLPFPIPPLPANTCKCYNTNDINMPESSSVGHSNSVAETVNISPSVTKRLIYSLGRIRLSVLSTKATSKTYIYRDCTARWA